jgi:hypothetical protein
MSKTRKTIVLLGMLTSLCGRAWAESCNPWNSQGNTIWDCGKLEGTAWLITTPVWIPLFLVYEILGGEVPAQRAEREEKEKQAAAAWQNMTHEERQEAIQLQQLQVQRQQQQLQNTELLLRALQQQQAPAAPPQQTTHCVLNKGEKILGTQMTPDTVDCW